MTERQIILEGEVRNLLFARQRLHESCTFYKKALGGSSMGDAYYTCLKSLDLNIGSRLLQIRLIEEGLDKSQESEV